MGYVINLKGSGNNFNRNDEIKEVYFLTPSYLSGLKNSNDLSQLGGCISLNTPLIRGTGAAHFNQAMTAASIQRADADLTYSFPLKNGSVWRHFGYATWFYLDSVPGIGDSYTFFAKGLFTVGVKFSFDIFVGPAYGPTLFIKWNHPVSSWNSGNLFPTASMTFGKLYFIAIGYADFAVGTYGAKDIIAYLYDYDADTEYTYSGTSTFSPAFDTSPFCNGCNYISAPNYQEQFDGIKNEEVFFRTPPSLDDMKLIRRNLYNATSGYKPFLSGFRISL